MKPCCLQKHFEKTYACFYNGFYLSNLLYGMLAMDYYLCSAIDFFVQTCVTHPFVKFLYSLDSYNLKHPSHYKD